MRYISDRAEADAFVGRPFLSFSSFILAALVGVISSFTFTTAYDMARAALFGEEEDVTGVWRGEWHGIQTVTIRLKDEGGMLCGTAQFSTIVASLGGPKETGRSGVLPLVNPKFDGKKLSFEVQGGPHTYPLSVVEMEMTFTVEGEAVLRRANARPEGPPEGKGTKLLLKKEPLF